MWPLEFNEQDLLNWNIPVLFWGENYKIEIKVDEVNFTIKQYSYKVIVNNHQFFEIKFEIERHGETTFFVRVNTLTMNEEGDLITINHYLSELANMIGSDVVFTRLSTEQSPSVFLKVKDRESVEEILIRDGVTDPTEFFDKFEREVYAYPKVKVRIDLIIDYLAKGIPYENVEFTFSTESEEPYILIVNRDNPSESMKVNIKKMFTTHSMVVTIDVTTGGNLTKGVKDLEKWIQDGLHYLVYLNNKANLELTCHYHGLNGEQSQQNVTITYIEPNN